MLQIYCFSEIYFDFSYNIVPFLCEVLTDWALGACSKDSLLLLLTACS